MKYIYVCILLILFGSLFLNEAISQETKAPAAKSKMQRQKQSGDQDAKAKQQDLAAATDLSKIKVPAGVKLIPDLIYREGNPMWKVDLAMPEAKSNAPRPGIVFIHGGGWQFGDKRTGYFLNGALEYAKQGYVCISVNYRLIGEAPFPACLQDVRNAVRWFRAHANEYNLDPNRIGGYGKSAGAHLVALLALMDGKFDPDIDGEATYKEYSSALQAACTSATPTDFARPLSGGGAEFALLTGPAESLDARVKAASPVTYVRADAPPYLLIHGSKDTIVDIKQAYSLNDALVKAGAQNIILMIIQDQGHGVFQNKSIITHAAMEAFFADALGVASDNE